MITTHSGSLKAGMSSLGDMRAASAVDSGAAAGLVPSINNGKPVFAPFETIEVEKLQARCTRLRKNLGVGAKHLSQGRDKQAWMVTLTYRGSNAQWRPDHVKECIRHARNWAKRLGFVLQYLWVIEVKKRLSGADAGKDAPHYHLVVWLPAGLECPKFDAKGWWDHGMTNRVLAVAPVRYVMKYVSKFDAEASFPKGARCYGLGGVSESGRRIRRWINLPAFVQARASIDDRWTRAPGGGWLDHSTGQIWPSEWGICSITRTCTRLVRLHAHPCKVKPGGPFSWLSPKAREF
jgi:hypothetical protein